MKTKTKIVYRVLSPDGLDTSAGATYPTQAKARAAVREFVARFAPQGYYLNAKRERIPVECIADHCTIERIGPAYVMPAHLWEFGGDLYSKRMPGDIYKTPLRRNYSRHHERIGTVADLKATLRAGGYCWPGGYPLFFMADDGAALSFEAVRENFKQIVAAIRDNDRNGWRVIGCSVNWEDGELYCAHTDERIPSAYAEPEVART